MTISQLRRIAGITIALLTPATARPQSASYSAPPDTIYTATRNPFRLYWVHGHDTTSSTTSAFLITAQHWSADRSGFTVHLTHTDLNIGRQSRRDSVHLDARGHATRLNPVTRAAEPAEFTLRLPPAGTRLTPGTTWSDTLNAGGTGSGGPHAMPHAYIITRTYRVTRRVDTLGVHAVEIVGDGTLHNSDAAWADSVAGSYNWFDLTGPVHERYLLDPATGRILEHDAHFDLRGRGGAPTASGTDTASAAGLIASDRVRSISPEQAHVALRALPGPDTTYTVTVANNAVTGVILVHTEHFTSAAAGSSIESGFARNDGLVGTIHSTYVRDRLATFDALWSDSTLRPLHHHVAAHGDTLKLRADATLDTLPLRAIDTTMLAPRTLWAVADYGMLEFLAPLIRTVAGDTTPHPIAIYRPTPRHWDLATLRVKRIGQGNAPALLATITSTGAPVPTTIVLAPDGTLLYGDDAGPTGARRVPKPSSPRQAEFLAIRQQIRQQ